MQHVVHDGGDARWCEVLLVLVAVGMFLLEILEKPVYRVVAIVKVGQLLIDMVALLSVLACHHLKHPVGCLV